MPTQFSSALEFLRGQAAVFAGRATIVGKGPSFAEFDAQAARRDRLVVGLNETALRCPCHAAFVIDEDVLDRHAAALAASGVVALLTPRVPHRPRAIGKLAMYGPPAQPANAEPAWVRAFGQPVLRFNLFSAEADAALGETVPGYNFSAPTLAHLLALAGFKDIQLAGIDGGTRYSADFREVEFKKLKSLQDSFDVQFADLRQVRDRFGVRFRSVRCQEATVLIGGEPEQCLATEVLRWSIESNTFLSVNFVEAGPVARERYAAGQSGTPFSFQRLFLPRLAGHHGRGVYFDSDMLVMRDVYELFNWDMGDAVLLGCEPTPGREAQFSVFLVDNARARWDPDALLADLEHGRLSYRQLIGDFAFAQPRASTLPVDWNSLEHFEQGRTANVHFTDMGTQPWLSIYNPAADLWCTALAQAVAERPAVQAALQLSLSRSWVRPSLQWQLEQQHHNPWTMPRAVRQLDQDWLPPHLQARPVQAGRRLQLLRWQWSSRVRRAMQSRNYRRLALARMALRKLF
jgi:hypothetical protein